MKKIMFYCQHLAGMGHLVRSTEIIRSLIKDFEVCFVNGGQIVSGFELPPAVEVISLPILRMEHTELKVVDGSQNLEEAKENRKNKLLAVFDQFKPDCLVTETFPFSKHTLGFELIPLLKRVQSSERPIRVACCLRDIIMTQEMTTSARAKRQQKVCNLINQYYDLVLFHADPKLQRLEECFPKVKDLNCKVYYTGYVAQSPPEMAPTDQDIASLKQEKLMIVASVGGGKHGYELLRAIVEASSILEKSVPHVIHAFTGPFMAEAEFLQLQKVAADKSNVIIRRYTSHLLEYMNKAELSISMAGYNTIMNILRTGVRSLVFSSPSVDQSTEQSIRSEKLEKLGVVEILHPSDLAPADLARKIITYLNRKPALHSFDLQGAEKASLWLKKLLDRQAIAA